MAIVLALSAALAYGSADFAGGLASRRTSPLAAALGAQLVGLVVLVAALPFTGGSLSPTAVAFGALAGLFGGSGIVLLYRALAAGPMSVVAPTTALSASAVPVLAGLALGERPGTTAVVGMAVSVLAVVLITRERGFDAVAPDRSVRPAVLAIALGGGAIFGLFFVFLHQAPADAGLWPLLAARSTSIPLLLVLAHRRGASLDVRDAGVRRIVVVSGVLDMAANIAYLVALRHGMLAVVAALTGLYPASTVVLAQTRLRERLQRPQLAGLGAAAVAAVLIAV